MSDIKDWSTIATDNNQSPPDGWPEGQLAPTNNNCAREDKAAVRRAYLDMEWTNPGGTPQYVSGTRFTIADNGEITNYSTFYQKNLQIRLMGTTPFTAYGLISNVAYAAPTTTVDFIADPGYAVVDSTLNSVSFGIFPKIKSSAPSNYPTNYHQGTICTNNAGDPAHDVDIATGNVRDQLDFIDMALTAILTKQIDANWAQGTNQGGFPSGLTLTANTTYKIFLIAKPDGTVDGGFDTSSTAANLLADATAYKYYRQIAFLMTAPAATTISSITNLGNGTGTSGLVNTIIRSTMSWARPAGVTDVKVTAFGSGGGGGGGSHLAPNLNGASGSSGGNVSFGSYCTANGGAGGVRGAGIVPGTGGTGGSGTKYDFLKTGTNGSNGSGFSGGAGGTGYGSGGNGGNGTGGGVGGGGGGAGGTVIKHIQGVTTPITVTVGNGGAGGANAFTGTFAQSGKKGAVIIEYY